MACVLGKALCLLLDIISGPWSAGVKCQRAARVAMDPRMTDPQQAGILCSAGLLLLWRWVFAQELLIENTRYFFDVSGCAASLPGQRARFARIGTARAGGMDGCFCGLGSGHGDRKSVV